MSETATNTSREQAHVTGILVVISMMNDHGCSLTPMQNGSVCFLDDAEYLNNHTSYKIKNEEQDSI